MTITSVRYQQLLKGIEKVLSESRNRIDISATVTEGYGDDASIFGGEDMLKTVMEGMLDRVSETVSEDMKKYFQSQNVEGDLLRIEGLLRKFEEVEEAERAINHEDRDSAKTSLGKVHLPNGVKPNDLVQQTAYNIMKEEKERLQKVAEELEKDVLELETLASEKERNLQRKIMKVEEVSKDLDYTADNCATFT
mmetsp:Transcript_20834/g.30840  ORF Transcript_20834/g.30840 Transcript_20834/m.30840 type:complete len:194 (-) Transcript_20834:3494-4075(-)